MVGFALGVVTGLPLSVINVAIVDAATAGLRRFAIGVGLGGAIADTVHAALAFGGVGRVITERPEWVRGLSIGAAIVIVIYAVVAWRRHLSPGARVDKPDAIPRGMVTGFMLTLPNPLALGAWVAVASALWPSMSLTGAGALAVGVGLGSAVIFTLIARFAASIRPDHPARRYVPRVAVVVLVGIAVVGVIRVL
ncbi:MAG TPA: LysE family transporter [Kofleriaceae bacterium]|nr:LysE family transporter [Kofleriaceae bacterium]